MNPDSIVKLRLRYGFIFILMIIGLSSFCTQFIARNLSNHSWLGTPLFGDIYNPFDWWKWTNSFYDYAPTIYNQAFGIFMLGFVCSILFFVVTVGIKSRSSRKNEGSHGTASFATIDHIRDAGLIPATRGWFSRKKSGGAGVYCGGFDDPKTGKTQYLRHDGPEHVCVIAPTRSGKGISLVIPTLLSCPYSVFVLDIKGENYAITSGWRKKHANNVVLRFDPADPDGSCAWNPLEEIRLGTSYQISDAQNIALMVIDDDGKGIRGDYWRAASLELISGAIIHALYKAGRVGRMPSLGDIGSMLKGGGPFAAVPVIDPDFNDGEDGPLAALFEEMLHVTLAEDTASQAAQHFIRITGGRFAPTSAKELSGIISTANTALSLYHDENVNKNTSHSDFKVSDLMDHDRPVSLYFITNPDNLVRMRPLARLLLTRIVAGLAGKMEFENGRAKTAHKHRLLMLLDEFPSLGKLDMFQNALAFLAGYGIKAYLITQDIQQILQAYDRYESILSNCHIRLAFTPNRQETAELLSKMAGQTTVINEQISNSGSRFGMIWGQSSRSYQSIQRPLMTPTEISNMPIAIKNENKEVIGGGEMLVFVAGMPVIKGRQTPYFLDPIFAARSKIAPPQSSDTIRGVKAGTFQP